MKNKILKTITIIALFFAFLAVFFWAVISANGYNFNLSSLFSKDKEENGGLLVQTGGVRINLDSQEIINELTISIDGEKKQVSENRVENILPGEHEIVISRKDHYDWKSIVNIESTLVTDISPLLFPINPKLEPKIPFTQIDKVFFSEYDDFAYYVVNKSKVGSGNGIWKLQLKNVSTLFNNVESEPVKIVNILPELKESIDTSNYEIIPSPDNKRILFKTATNSYFVFEAENTNPNIKSEDLLSIEDLFGYIPQYIKWFKGSSSLIMKDKNLLAEYILSTKKEIIISYDPENEPIFGVNGDSVTYVSFTDNKIYNYKDEAKTMLELENIDLPKKIDTINIDRDNGKFVLFSTDGIYYYLNTIDSYIYKMGDKINIIEFSKDGQSVLFEKEGNLYSLVIREIKAKDEFETSTNLIISNFDKEKFQVKYNNRSSHILIFSTVDEKNEENTTIKVIDRKGENSITILSNSELNEFGKKIVDNAFYMPSDNKELVVMLREKKFENDKEIESKEKYIYSMRLEK